MVSRVMRGHAGPSYMQVDDKSTSIQRRAKQTCVPSTASCVSSSRVIVMVVIVMVMVMIMVTMFSITINFRRNILIIIIIISMMILLLELLCGTLSKLFPIM